jgi:hypothetical protein
VCRADPEVLLPTTFKLVDVTDPASVAAGAVWWTALTARGGEGMVVKPLDFLHRGPKGVAQPAVKCRGPEYLRIIYGPDYDAPVNLSRLRKRGLGHKRSLALGEFALGVEGLERFVRREPLRRVHECGFGVPAPGGRPAWPCSHCARHTAKADPYTGRSPQREGKACAYRAAASPKNASPTRRRTTGYAAASAASWLARTLRW